VAQKIQTLFIDDLDGSEADGTVRFGLDGAEYEIDLNAEHAQALRVALARYVGAARRAGGGTRRPARGGRRARADGVGSTEVREWAKTQGIEVKDRGRAPVWTARKSAFLCTDLRAYPGGRLPQLAWTLRRVDCQEAAVPGGGRCAIRR
jgi:nucleoid-associated protein Lsr2